MVFSEWQNRMLNGAAQCQGFVLRNLRNFQHVAAATAVMFGWHRRGFNQMYTNYC